MKEEKDPKKNKFFSLLKEFFEQEKLDDKPPVDQPKDLKEHELESGAKIKVEGELKEMAKVFVVGEDGKDLPAPDGEHKLKDGSVINVVNGAIEKFTPAPSETPEDFDKKLEPIQKELAEAKELYRSLKEEFAAQAAAFKEEMKKSKEAQFATFKLLEEYLSVPDESALENKNKFNATPKKDYQQTFKNIAKVLEENKDGSK